MNDKHSVAPSMFRCHYHPCPYESKRESNCKQHMEKAHGWVYVRSKNNGKLGKGSHNEKTPSTPQMSTPGSNTFSAPSPTFSDLPAYKPHQQQNSKPVHSSTNVEGLYDNETSTSFDETFGPFDSSFHWKDAGTDYNFGGLADCPNDSHRPSWNSPMANDTGLNSVAEDQSLFGENFDWSNMDHDLTSLNIQLITPAASIGQCSLDAFSRNASVSLERSPHIHDQPLSLSPGAQGDAMLYSPYSMPSNDDLADEGYGELPQELVSRPSRDFNLFDSTGLASLSSHAQGAMFDDLPPLSGWTGRSPDADLARQLGMTGDVMQLDD